MCKLGFKFPLEVHVIKTLKLSYLHVFIFMLPIQFALNSSHSRKESRFQPFV